MPPRSRQAQPIGKLSRSFYARPAEVLAPDLIGTTLVHRLDGREFRARIVETEAYTGPHDLASHSSKGRTRRTEVMFGPPG
ncbi:MAG TPA: DNA-3-methyladenine glycosylase, partial [Tepidisphaeraceae bacterium]|nr:DNA-3-methyladenine glycosylase [Tepidisphaeraceae bacterium]